MTSAHDPTEDQRIAAVVREHFHEHFTAQEPAVMQTATVQLEHLAQPTDKMHSNASDVFGDDVPAWMADGPELAPEVAPARAPRSLAVKLARRVGIVLAWVVLLVALAVVSGLAQVSVVLGQQALVSDGVGPLAAAGVAAICSIVVGLGALAVLGKLADRLCEVEP